MTTNYNLGVLNVYQAYGIKTAGMGTGLLLAGMSMAHPRVKQLAQGAALGGISGAAFGAAHADPGDKVYGAIRGAGLGALLGAVPAAAAAGTPMMSAMGGALAGAVTGQRGTPMRGESGQPQGVDGMQGTRDHTPQDGGALYRKN